MSERTLLYTAWTRAKDLVIGVGEKEIFEHSVKTFKMKSRNTNLSERIQEFAQKYRIEPKGDKSYRQQEIIESDKKIVSGMNSEKSNSIKSSGKISIPKVKDIGKKSKSTSSISKPKLKIKPVSFNKGIAPK
jgi:ATP-dependent exoDNAse (exonuclease V) beta subunit